MSKVVKNEIILTRFQRLHIPDLLALGNEYDHFYKNLDPEYQDTEIYLTDKEWIEELLTNPNRTTYLAYQKGNSRLSGFISYFVITELKAVFIEDLFVSQNIRKKGFGQALLQKAKDYASRKHFSVLFYVTHGNNNALEFYQKQGFSRDKNVWMTNKYAIMNT